MGGDTSSGRRFENSVARGFCSVGLREELDQERFIWLLEHWKECKQSCFCRQFSMHADKNISGCQKIDFAAIVLSTRIVDKSYGASGKGRFIPFGIECKFQMKNGTVCDKNGSSLENLALLTRHLKNGRLVLGGEYWTQSKPGFRKLSEMKARCGSLSNCAHERIRAITIDEFKDEVQKLTGEKWTTDEWWKFYPGTGDTQLPLF